MTWLLVIGAAIGAVASVRFYAQAQDGMERFMWGSGAVLFTLFGISWVFA